MTANGRHFTVPKRKAHRRYSIRRWVAAICVIAIAAVLGGLPTYVRPQTDPPRKADAILILGGEYHDRYPFGLALAAAGLASSVVVSNPKGSDDRWLTERCANPPRGITMHCFAPDPSTTKGEGRELRRLASQYGWKTVIVVTFRPHISRARFILQQCFDGGLVMVASPAQLALSTWAFQYLYQTAGYVRAVLQPGC